MEKDINLKCLICKKYREPEEIGIYVGNGWLCSDECYETQINKQKKKKVL